MRIVHLETVVQTTFGVLDENDNSIPQQPIQVQINRFDAESFEEAHGIIAKARDEALEAASAAGKTSSADEAGS